MGIEPINQEQVTKRFSCAACGHVVTNSSNAFKILRADHYQIIRKGEKNRYERVRLLMCPKCQTVKASVEETEYLGG